MSATLYALRASLDMTDVCHKIIPWLTLDEIGSKICEARLAQQSAFSAHGNDAQELRKHLNELCKAVAELNDLCSGMEAGTGR